MKLIFYIAKDVSLSIKLIKMIKKRNTDSAYSPEVTELTRGTSISIM